MTGMLDRLWMLLISKLGSFAGILQILAQMLHVALKERDAKKVTHICDHLERVAKAILHLVDGLRAKVADGSIDAGEAADAAKDLEAVIFEASEMAQ